VNPKGHPSSSVNPSEPLRKVNAAISLRSGQEIDNQVATSNEPYKHPQNFLQNFSLYYSFNPESRSSCASNDYANPSRSKSPSDKEEPNEKDSTSSVDPLSPKDSSLPLYC